MTNDCLEHQTKYLLISIYQSDCIFGRLCNATSCVLTPRLDAYLVPHWVFLICGIFLYLFATLHLVFNARWYLAIVVSYQSNIFPLQYSHDGWHACMCGKLCYGKGNCCSGFSNIESESFYSGNRIPLLLQVGHIRTLHVCTCMYMYVLAGNFLSYFQTQFLYAIFVLSAGAVIYSDWVLYYIPSKETEYLFEFGACTLAVAALVSMYVGSQDCCTYCHHCNRKVLF